MPIRVKTGSSTWANVTELRVKTAISTWSDVIKGRVKTAANVWSDFFTAVITPTVQSRSTISLSGGINASNNIMNDSTFVTITSTRYSWNNATGVTYVWQSSPDDSNWSDIGTAQSTTNPASGSSSSSLALTLSPSYFTSGPDMYFRFKFMATNSTYGTNASSESLSKLVSYYGTPIPQSPYPEITGSTTVGNTAFGNIGVWTNSPTSYDYRWYFMSGSTSYPLTFAQARSVSNKTLSGFSASLSTSTNHGYKANDQLIISGMDSLFNGTHTITSRTNSTVSFTLPTPTAWSASTAYSIGSLVSFSGNAYYASISMPAPTLFSASSAYNVGDNAWDGFTRYRCIQAMSAVSAWSSSSNYPTGSIVSHNGTRWRAEQNSGMGYVIPGTSTPVGAQTPSSTNTTYWSEINVRLSSTSYWANANPNNSSYWTIQSFSGTAASGTTTAPNYYEGSSLSSQSFSLVTPTVDYRSQLNMIDKALYFAVKAYNPATLSPSEYSVYKLVYGVPVITVGTITAGSTTASIPYTHSYMTSYDIDIKYAGTSISTYPRVVTSPSTPISVSGLTAPRDYTYSITPKNGEGTSGVIKTGTFSTILEQWTITWNANGGTGGGTTVENKGLSHTAPSPGTRPGYTFNGYYDTPTGDYLYGPIDSGGPFTPTSNITMTARWSVTPIIPTITMGANSGVSQTAGTINWTSTNQTSFSSTGTFSGSGTTGTSISKTGLTAGTNYTGTVTVTSSTGHTASANYSLTTSQVQYTVTWNANGGTGGGSTGPFNAGTAHTAPSPGTRAGYTFNGYYNTPSGDYLYGPIASGGPFTPPSNITMTARWSVTPIIPTITMGANSGVSQTAGTINWTSTNQTSFSSTGTFSGSGTTGTSISKTGLTAGTNYTGTVTVTSSTGHTASTNYSLTTSVAQYTVTWNANGGTGGGSTGPFNAGTSHTAPSPGTRPGFTFSGYYNTPSGDYLYGPIASGGPFTPPSTITMYARWNAIVPNVTQITALGLGNTTAPYIRFTFTSTNAASLSIMLYRSATSSTGPWTALSARNIRTTSGTVAVDFTSRTGTTSNWYYVDVIPYSNSDGTGTAGTTRTSRVKRGTETTTTTVYP
jgi:hypothetical protein